MGTAQAEAMKEMLAQKLAAGTPLKPADGLAGEPSSSTKQRKKKKRAAGSRKPSTRGGAVPAPTEFGSNETRDDQMLRKAFILRDDAETVGSYLDSGTASIWCVDMNAQTHLFPAVLRSKARITKLLVEKGADVNTVDNAGCSPIFYAAYAGFAEGVQMLLDAGATLRISDRLGNTPLHDLAGSDGYLNKRFASPSHAEKHGEYFISWSPPKGSKQFRQADSSFLQTGRLLLNGALENGLDPHARNDAGESAADLAEQAGFGALKELIEAWVPSTEAAAGQRQKVSIDKDDL
jgi:hypothetical protein